MAIEELPALIEDNAAKYWIAPRKLWRLALDAIEKDVLRPVLPEGQSLDTEFSHGGMGPLTRRRIIRSASSRIERHEPSNDEWAKELKFEAKEFDSWFKKALQAQNIPAHPRRASGRKKTIGKSVAEFIAETYPDGVPAGVTVKSIRRDFEGRNKGLSVSERTVRRALGRA
jgi:hypothetical protein